MSAKIRLGISSCLLGNEVRYDGGHKLDRFLTATLGAWVEWVPVCPEVECGLSIPREAMHLTGSPDAPRLVTVRTGIDHTERMQRWARKKLSELDTLDLAGFVFKSRSPSSGMAAVKVYGAGGVASTRGVGIFAKAFMDRFPVLPVEDDGRLHDPPLRENFIERVFVYRRWQDLGRKGWGLGDLVEFHTDHKLLIMAHSQKHYAEMGRLVARAKTLARRELQEQYVTTLMAGLKLLATARKNTNVLQHMVGYLKDHLSADEKQELLEVVERYHQGQVPLVAPLVLIQHYVRKYDVSYLKRQHYLNPHPGELMLRNHV